VFTGAEVVKTEEQAAVRGGTAGDQFDPCYHLACDTIDDVSREALDVNVDAVAYAVYNLAATTEAVNGSPASSRRASRRTTSSSTARKAPS